MCVYHRVADEKVGWPADLNWLWRVFVFAIWTIDFLIVEAIVIMLGTEYLQHSIHTKAPPS